LRIIRELDSHQLGPCVVTIGNFDGLHRGHQAILTQLSALSRQSGLPSVLICFDPSPAEYFRPENAPARLMRLREKVAVLAEYDLDELILLRFNDKLASVTAEDFIEKILLDTLQVRQLIVGNDFRFGHQRKGDYALLKSASAKHDFDVIEAKTTCYQKKRVSSTWIRELLRAGQFDVATSLLNRPYSQSGHIIHGAELGRKLGYPTANIPVRRLTSPLHGIYVVTMTGIDDKPLPGVASVGTRPVVSGVEFLLEVHLFDFDADIYGRLVEVQFYQKLRDELPFDSLDDLKVQMKIDCEQARAYFENKQSGS
jgi:riboflavin kinase/FMN adenylyltransferase